MPEETPKNESPTELPPAAPEEMPDEPAKPAAPGNDVEDLFKDADTTDKKTDAIEPAETPDDAAPAPTEKKSDDVDDLFKDAGDKDSKTSAVNAAELKLSNAIKSIELEELFVDGQAAAPTAEVKPQATEMETLPATTVKVPVSRLQKSRPNIGPRPEAAAVAPTTDGMRVWTDSTGKYRINARLVSVSATSVRLLKDTGKYTTVPKTRLSAGDLAFVRGLSAASVAGKF
jgi:hypothetical protein